MKIGKGKAGEALVVDVGSGERWRSLDVMDELAMTEVS